MPYASAIHNMSKNYKTIQVEFIGPSLGEFPGLIYKKKPLFNNTADHRNSAFLPISYPDLSGFLETNRWPKSLRTLGTTYALLTKLVRSRWLDIGQVLFFAFLWTETNLDKGFMIWLYLQVKNYNDKTK